MYLVSSVMTNDSMLLQYDDLSANMESNTEKKKKKQKYSVIINNWVWNGKRIRLEPLQKLINPLVHALNSFTS